MIKTLADKNHPAGTPGVCMVAVIPVRKAPKEQSEMISQLVFGEYYNIDETMEQWLRITNLFDHFSGWIDRKFFQEAGLVKGMESRIGTVLYSNIAEIEMPDGSSQLIPAGSNLPCYEEANHEFTIGIQKFRIRPLMGDLLLPASQKVFETARRFMNTPYLWGGRSVFGFDCSGFMQTVYKIHGVSLQRETSQQVSSGKEIAVLNDSVPGDLAFFCNIEGKVNHVGMVLAGRQIIHCSGWVRIDRLDERGIFNRERDTYTHRLKEVRRII